MHVRLPVAPQPAVAPPVVHDVLRSAGRPLDPPLREAMQAQLGHDFSRVRVHTDARAAESARAVGALAYTAGSDVVFAEGRFGPGTAEGRRLLTHELAHVIQQRDAGPRPGALPIAPANDPAEAEADRVTGATPPQQAGLHERKTRWLPRLQTLPRIGDFPFPQGGIGVG